MYKNKHIKLRIYPDAVLRRKTNPVINITGATFDLIHDMTRLMHSCDGIGLAAPQVGILQRIVIVENEDETIPMINPEIVEERGDDILEEGCLSLPGIWLNVNRSRSVVIQDVYPDGQAKRRNYSGLTARVIIHEIDHLNGVLILDYASALEKYMINEKLGYKAIKYF